MPLEDVDVHWQLWYDEYGREEGEPSDASGVQTFEHWADCEANAFGVISDLFTNHAYHKIYDRYSVLLEITKPASIAGCYHVSFQRELHVYPTKVKG